MLKRLTARVHTEQDLIDARPEIRKIIDRIVESPTSDDQIILYNSGDVRNVLSTDPEDSLTGDVWVHTTTVALGDLYTACVEADYISRPTE